MSPNRPKKRRKDETTKEKAFAGHVLELAGMFRSFTTIGNTTVKPETKYSYKTIRIAYIVQRMAHHTERI